jgi:drug/metabolite transporter (DMT)-like permease
MYLYPFLLQTPLFIVFIFSGLLLKSKEEVKQEYTSKVPWYGVALVLLLSAALIISAVTGYTEKINREFDEVSAIYWVMAIGGFLCLIYGRLVLKVRGERI